MIVLSEVGNTYLTERIAYCGSLNVYVILSCDNAAINGALLNYNVIRRKETRTRFTYFYVILYF